MTPKPTSRRPGRKSPWRGWKALGKHTYEECKPWAVWEWVAREKARADELQKQVNELIERL